MKQADSSQKETQSDSAPMVAGLDMCEQLKHQKQMAICADCGHEKLHHTGGLGMCGSYQNGYFCRCNQYRKTKSRKFNQ